MKISISNILSPQGKALSKYQLRKFEGPEAFEISRKQIETSLN